MAARTSPPEERPIRYLRMEETDHLPTDRFAGDTDTCGVLTGCPYSAFRLGGGFLDHIKFRCQGCRGLLYYRPGPIRFRWRREVAGDEYARARDSAGGNQRLLANALQDARAKQILAAQEATMLEGVTSVEGTREEQHAAIMRWIRMEDGVVQPSQKRRAQRGKSALSSEKTSSKAEKVSSLSEKEGQQELFACRLLKRPK